MHLLITFNSENRLCSNPDNPNEKLLRRVTGSQKQTTAEIYSHRHLNLISTILRTNTDTPADIYANLKRQSNEFGYDNHFPTSPVETPSIITL